MHSVVRITRTSAYRGLSKVDKAVKLVEEEQCSLPEASNATGVPVTTIWRAKKAKAEKRTVGVPGRPLLLGIDGENCLVVAIQEADEQRKQLTYAKLRERVCILSAFFFCFFTIYLYTTPILNYYIRL